MKRIHTFLLLLLISVIVTISVKITEEFSRQSIPDNMRLKGELDYSVENFSLAMMDKSGNVQYNLSADSMMHYRDTDTTRLDLPNIELFKKADEHWLIKANQGQVSTKGAEIVLSGDVELKSEVSTQQQPFIIMTENLNINPEKNTVSTKDQILFTGEGMKLSSTGMIADIENETIKLLNKVRASYVPLY
jgi:lipopolysaccharide export system protein LptC